MKRLQVTLLAVILTGVAACASSNPPPSMSAINQSDGASTEIEADSWCFDGLFSESCAAVDGPVAEVVAGCDDNVVVGLPDGLTPEQGDHLEPVTNDEAWLVTTQEGTVVVSAEGSGRWSRAFWTFELTREDGEC